MREVMREVARIIGIASGVIFLGLLLVAASSSGYADWQLANMIIMSILYLSGVVAVCTYFVVREIRKKRL